MNPENYNDTLNLPKTSFPMRAGLTELEPALLQAFEEKDIYEQLMKKNSSKPLFVLHDGPPYANGNIHLGTALNKILKDFVVRYKNMSGFKAPYIPGWDTHGLPTEIKARKQAGVGKSSGISSVELRKLCREFVLDSLNDQREQFKRLGVIGQWDNPYATLNKEFEAKQIEIFADMACKGYIYKGLKSVYWCTDCETALAEAEIEYAQDPCYSVYVKFPVKDDNGTLTKLGVDLAKTYFIIWTTTTWTLPANVAICAGESFEYCVVKYNEEYYVLAEALHQKCMKAAGYEDYKIIAKIKGSELEYIRCAHPFINRDSLVITGDLVTLESGTGLVHIAPGHGSEDFEVAKNYPELEVVVPVDSKGFLTKEAGIFEGLFIEEAGKVIAEHLQNHNYLLATQKIIHQYPHCWRCKKPVIFRATEQWFCSIDDIKQGAVEAIKTVKWLPLWGEDRITAMVEGRQDWCISRQRKWGVPIPIFLCKNCEEPLINKDAMLAVADLFGKEGSDAWYKKDASEILLREFKCSKCGHSEFEKENDIMDVWFDSGVSHAAVCGGNSQLHWPADLYLEGADQYRGWFQSSLLTAVASAGKAPYKAVVTHGWVVDGKGRKMSKSLGNGIEPKEIIDEFGADVLRLWVASSDYHSDIRVSKEILKQLSESYRKIRNTSRYILGNLFDFDPNADLLDFCDFLPIDTYAMAKLDSLVKEVNTAYENYEFFQVYHKIYHFCVVDMSNFYLDIIKDRMYVEKSNGKSRRAAQSAIYIILDTLVRLLAPILAYTPEEIWQNIPKKALNDSNSVLFNEIPKEIGVSFLPDFIERWNRIHEIHGEVKKMLEQARKNKEIGSSLEAKVILSCSGELYDFINAIQQDLKDVFIVSGVSLVKNQSEKLGINVERADGQKCQRCWGYSPSVGGNLEHPNICNRCSKVLESL